MKALERTDEAAKARPIRAFAPWLLVAAAALAIALAPLPWRASRPADRAYRIEAGDFAYHPAVLHANPGDRVTLQLVSRDVVHGLHLDGYGVEIQADPGQSASLTFVADKAGTFRFRCSVTCGALHPFMIGKLQVGPPLLLWRAAGLALLAAAAGARSLFPSLPPWNGTT